MAEVDETQAPDETTPEPEHVETPEPETPEQEPDEDEDEDETPAPEPEPEPAGLTEKQIEARFSKLDSENQRHAKRIGEILEEDANDLLQCPLCSSFIAGFILNAPVADEPRAATLGFLGVENAAELEHAADKGECPECKGSGRVVTGSKVHGYDVLDCATCDGFGYVLTTGDRPQAPAAPIVNGGGEPELRPVNPDMDRRIRELHDLGYTIVPPMQPVQG